MDESVALTHALKPLFGDAGFPLEPATPARWYLRCPAGAHLPQFAPPQTVLGDDIARHMPQGDGARRWQHLLNEAQVILHNHPVNAERARRGRAPVNSVWFWGAGELPDWVRTPFTQVASSDDIVRALARLAKLEAVAPTPSILDDLLADRRLLIDLAAERNLAVLGSVWFEPIRTLLSRRKVDALALHFASGERYRYRRGHRWRFWRRLRSVVAQ